MDMSTLVPTLSLVTLLIVLVVFGLGGLRGVRRARQAHIRSALDRSDMPNRPLARNERG